MVKEYMEISGEEAYEIAKYNNLEQGDFVPGMQHTSENHAGWHPTRWFVDLEHFGVPKLSFRVEVE